MKRKLRLFMLVLVFLFGFNACANNEVVIKSDDEGTTSKQEKAREMVIIGENVSNSEEWNEVIQVATSPYHSIGLKSDGTVVSTGNNEYGQCNVDTWRDIVSVEAGDYFSVALKKDGTVLAVGDNSYGQCDVDEWTTIIAISAGFRHTVGLKKDGTVIAVGDNDCGVYSSMKTEYTINGQCDVDSWKDITVIKAGGFHTLGLTSQGRVVATGFSKYGQTDVQLWEDIKSIESSGWDSIGIKSDGTVITAGENIFLSGDNFVQIVASQYHAVGLKANGTVVASGNNDYGQCDVSEWSNIVSVAVGVNHTVGLKADGTVVAVGDNSFGQCNVSNLKDVEKVFADASHTFAIALVTEKETSNKEENEMQNSNDTSSKVSIVTEETKTEEIETEKYLGKYAYFDETGGEYAFIEGIEAVNEKKVDEWWNYYSVVWVDQETGEYLDIGYDTINGREIYILLAANGDESMIEFMYMDDPYNVYQITDFMGELYIQNLATFETRVYVTE